MNEWHDISEIDKFKDDYEFNQYVVLVADEDEGGGYNADYTDIAFGIALIPKETKRFFCVPYDEEEN